MMLQIFLQVFFRPLRAFDGLTGPLFSHSRFFIFYGIPLIVAGSLGRAAMGLERYEGMQEELSVFMDISISFVLFWVNLTSYCIAMLLGAMLIWKLAPRFDSKAGFGSTLSVVVLAYTPFLIAQPIEASGNFRSVFSIAGLIYTVLLYAKGVRIMASTPQKNIVGFTMVSFFILFGIFYIVTLVSSGMLIFEAR